MNVRTIIILFCGFVFAIYAIISFLIGDLTPLYLLIGGLLFITVGSWGIIGVLGVAILQFCSLQLPFPPQPDMWQMCGLLAAPGLVIALIRGQASPRLVIPPYLLMSILLVSIVLIISGLVHSPSVKSFITVKAGRYYTESILLLFMPFAASMIPMKYRKVENYIIIGFFLSFSFAMMDLAARFAPSVFGMLYYFFDVATDTLNFSGGAETWDYDRFSGIGYFLVYSACATLCLTPINDSYRKKRKYFFLLLALALFVFSLISGYRKFLGYPLILVPIYLYVEKAYNMRVITMFLLTGLILGGTVIININRLPGAYQRALLVVPGVESMMGEDVARRTFGDAYATEGGRELQREFSFEVLEDGIPFFGKGYYPERIVASQNVEHFDLVMSQNRYPIGVMSSYINLGPFGLISYIAFTISVLIYVISVLRYSRKYFYGQRISRVVAVLSGLLLFYFISWSTRGSIQDYYIKGAKFLGPIVLLHQIMVSRLRAQKDLLTTKSLINKH